MSELVSTQCLHSIPYVFILSCLREFWVCVGLEHTDQENIMEGIQ